MVKVRITESTGGAAEGLQEPDNLAERLEQVFARFQGTREELIPLLQRVQEELGFLPEEAMLRIARFIRVPESAVYAVATFYAQFRFTPIGKRHVMVCRGTSCHVRGAARILQEIEKQLGIKAGEVTPDLEYSLETVACIGACGLSPCLTVNKRVEAKMSPKRVTSLLRDTTPPADISSPTTSRHTAE